jgi:hypothetical protein
LGITNNKASFGILEAANDYMVIPPERKDQVVEQIRTKWSICFSNDYRPVSKEVYEQITKNFGINCVPIVLFDTNRPEKRFQTYSFQPKRKELRNIAPPDVVSGTPSPLLDAKKGVLRQPTV